MASRKRTKSELKEADQNAINDDSRAWAGVVHKIVDFLMIHGFWKAVGGAVILIFAWQIARHYFPSN